MDTQQLHQNFLKDFTDLLRKYNAEFEMMEGSPEIWFFSTTGEDGSRIRSYSYFNLPNYVHPK